jgi:hypothetical protein
VSPFIAEGAAAAVDASLPAPITPLSVPALVDPAASVLGLPTVGPVGVEMSPPPGTTVNLADGTSAPDDALCSEAAAETTAPATTPSNSATTACAAAEDFSPPAVVVTPAPATSAGEAAEVAPLMHATATDFDDRFVCQLESGTAVENVPSPVDNPPAPETSAAAAVEAGPLPLVCLADQDVGTSLGSARPPRLHFRFRRSPWLQPLRVHLWAASPLLMPRPRILPLF